MTQTTDQASRRLVPVVVALVIVVCLATVGGAGAWLLFMNGGGITALDGGSEEVVLRGAAARAPINQLLNVTLPSSATELTYIYTQNFTDWSGTALFAVPAPQADVWLQNAGFCFELPLAEAGDTGIFTGVCRQDTRVYTVTVNRTDAARYTFTFGVYTF